MPEAWRDWPEAQKLRARLAVLLSRPNGRRMANHLLKEVDFLLTYKNHRKGSWQRK
jgi:hypothetical protein